MKTIKQYILTLGSVLGLLSFGSTALADGGLYLEPGVTYQFNSKSSLELPSPLSNTSGAVEGLGASLKVGLHATEIIFAGVDGRYSRPNFKDSSNNLNVEAESMNYAVLLGAQMPDTGLRVWGEYVFGGNLDPAEDRSIDFKFDEANGYRLGAGLRLKAVSLNLEYQELKYDKTNAVVLGLPVNSDNSELTDKALIGSVSFPIEF